MYRFTQHIPITQPLCRCQHQHASQTRSRNETLSGLRALDLEPRHIFDALGGFGAFGAGGATGAPGIFGAAGIEGIPGAGAAFAPQLGHSSAFGSTSAPHFGHFTGPIPVTAGLKHIVVYLPFRFHFHISNEPLQRDQHALCPA